MRPDNDSEPPTRNRHTSRSHATTSDRNPLAVGQARSAWSRLLLFAGLFLVAAVHVASIEYPADDAYIHLRIARNLVESGEPYFNLGDAVKGDSSTAWLLLVSALTAGFPDPLLGVAVVNSVLFVLTVLLAIMLADTVVPEASLPTRALVGITTATALLPSSVQMMETSLAMALVLGGLLLLSKKRLPGWALLGVALATRAEVGVFLLVAVALWAYFERPSGRTWLRGLGWGLVGFGPFLVFDLLAYGTPVPNTLAAKDALYDLSFLEATTTLVPGIRSPLAALLYVTVALLAVAGATRQLLRRNTVGLQLAIGGVGLVVVYMATARFVFPWYQPLYLVPLGLAAIWAVATTERSSFVAAGTFVIAPIVMSTVVMIAALTPLEEMQPDTHEYARVADYTAVGEAVDRACESCTIMTSEIGALGYSFGGRVEDAGGLTNVDAIAYHPLSVPEQRGSRFLGAIPLALIEDLQPDVVVSYETLLETNAIESLNGYSIYLCDTLFSTPEPITGTSVFGSDWLAIMTSRSLDDASLEALHLQITAEPGCEPAGR